MAPMNASCVPESVPRNLLRGGHDLELVSSLPEFVDRDVDSHILAELSFPMRLHIVLTSAPAGECTNIAGWVPVDATRFRIYDAKRFESELLPLYFDGIDYQTFQWLLKYWGFQSLPDDLFYHRMFQRDHPELCCSMTAHQDTEMMVADESTDGARHQVTNLSDEISTNKPQKPQGYEMSWMNDTFLKSLSDGSLQVNAPIIEMVERQTGCDMETVLAKAVLAQLQDKLGGKKSTIHTDAENNANDNTLNRDYSIVSFGSTTIAAGMTSQSDVVPAPAKIPLALRPLSSLTKRRREQHSFAVASAFHHPTQASFIASYLAERQRKARTVTTMTPRAVNCQHRFDSPVPSVRGTGVSELFAPHLEQPAQVFRCKRRRIENKVLPPTDLLDSIRPSTLRTVTAPSVNVGVGYTISTPASKNTSETARHVVTEPCLQKAAAHESDDERK